MSEVPNTQLKVKSPATPSKPPKGKSARGSVLRWFSKSVTFAFFLVVGVIMLFVSSSIRNHHTSNAYTDAKDSTAASVYNKFYQTAYTYAEQKNHVSNRAMISIEDVTKLSRLEVLKVSDSEFVIENASDNDNHITSWIEVQGIGVFTVDLQVAEFIKDEQRQYVLVRVPKPELTNCAIEKTGKPFWRNDLWNDSVKVGVQLSQQQMSEGRQLIEDSIRQNRNFYDSALNAAESSIQSLVKSWNPQLPDLTVEVEFIDPS